MSLHRIMGRGRLRAVLAVVLLATLLVAVPTMVTPIPKAAALDSPGSLDLTFGDNPGWGLNAIAVAASGSIGIGDAAGFSIYSDAGVRNTLWTNGQVFGMATQMVGSTQYFLVGGGTSPLMRYSTAGVKDTAFATGQSGTHRALLVVGTSTDERIFAGASNDFKRYTANGAVEATVAMGGAVNALAMQTISGTDYVLVGGAFGIKRYTTASVLDSSFDVTPGGTVNAIAMQSDGKILVGGSFGIKRYLADGTADSSFASITTAVTSLAVQSNGKILAGTTTNLKRYDSAGVADAAFSTATSANGTFSVSTIAIDNVGRAVIGGPTNANTKRFIRRYFLEYAVPGVPPAPTAVAGDSQATVTVTAGSGATPTSYTVTAVGTSPAQTCTVTGASGSCVISGLTNGTAYTFTATATNTDPAATSASSPASTAVTPVVNPVFLAASVNTAGTYVTLTFNKSLSLTTAPTSAFTVNSGGTENAVTSVSVSGQTVVLGLTRTVGIGQIATVAYLAPSSDDATTNAAIQNLAGNDAFTLTTTTIPNNSTADITPPTYVSSATNVGGTTIVLTYSEALAAATAPSSAFTVLVDGAPATVGSVSVSGDKVTLGVSPSILSGQVVSVAYAAPTASASTTNPAVQDVSGLDASALTASSVTNNSLKLASCLAGYGLGGVGGTTRANASGGDGCVIVEYGSTSEQFSYIGEPYSWTVPAGVSSVKFKVYGAGGGGITTGGDIGALTAYDGGKGGYAEGTYAVTPGQSFKIVVGDGGIGNDNVKPDVTYTINRKALSNNEALIDVVGTPSTFVVGATVVVSGVGAPFDGTHTITQISGSNRFYFAATGANLSYQVAVGTATIQAKCVDSVLPTTYGGGGSTRNQNCATTGNGIDAFASGGGGSSVYTFSSTPKPVVSAGGGGGAGTQGAGGAGGGNDVSALTGGAGANGGGSGTSGGKGATQTAAGGSSGSASPTIPGAGTGGAGGNPVTSGASAADAVGGNSTYGGGGGGGGYYGGGAGGTAGGGGGGSSKIHVVDLVGPKLATVNPAVLGTNGLDLTLTFDESLSSTTAAISNYKVTVDGKTVTVSSRTVSATTVKLTLASPISSDQTVLVSYTAPSPLDSATTNLAVQDTSGNDAATFTNQAVVNNSALGPDKTPPNFSSMSISGSQVILTFDETLATSPALEKSAFTVFVDEEARTPTTAVVSGSTVVLTFSSAIPSTAVVTAAYEAPAVNASTANVAVQDLNGNDALSFSRTYSPNSTDWEWTTPFNSATNTPGGGCDGAGSINRAKKKLLPNGVSYTVGVTGDHLCINEVTESLSQRGGQAGDFVATGLVTEPGLKLTTSNVGCPSSSMCTPRGTMTLSFDEPVTNPVMSFAGWGGGSGSSTAWSEMTVVTPGVTVTKLSGTNIEVVDNGTHIQPIVKNPSIQCHMYSGYGATAQAGCGSFQINGTVTSVSFAVVLGTARGTGYLDAWNLTASMSEDFGLVPTTYESAGVASHGVGGLKLGATVAADQASALYATTNADAVARWTSLAGNPKADDGVAEWVSSPSIAFGAPGTTYSTQVALSGVTSTANLCGWIDFNRDEVFSYSERACATDPVAGATSATLTWVVPAVVKPGLTYARVRLSYDILTVPTGKVASGEVEDYSLTILATDVPIALDDTSIGALGAMQVITPLANDQIDGSYVWTPSSVKLCTPDELPPNCSATVLEVDGEGTYRVQPDGTVQFTPLPAYTGTARPVTYQVSDTAPTPRVRSATITPTVLPAPTATPETKTLFPGESVDFSAITGAGGLATGTGLVTTGSGATCLYTPNTTTCDEDNSVTIPGEGTFILDPLTGVVTYLADENATDGPKTSITYRVTDSVGQTATSTLTPILTPAPPVATPETLSVLPGGTISFTTITGASGLATGTDLQTSGAGATCLVDVSVTPNTCGTGFTNADGAWSIDQATGVVTFIANDPLSAGTKTPVTYRVTDVAGQTATSTLTPVVPPPPVALNDTQAAGAYDTNQTISPLANDMPGAESAPLVLSSLKFCPTSATAPFTSMNCSLVPSQASPLVTADGKYWVDPATGEVTFDPDPDFSGTVTQPVQYVVADSLGQETTAKITLIVSNPTPPSATPETLSVLPGGTISFTTITGASGLATGTDLQTSGAGATCLVDVSVTPNTCGTGFTNADGAWSIDQATGVVTFIANDPLSAGTKTPVTYRVTDVAGQTATSTLTPVVPPPPVALNDTQAAGAYDTNQTISPLANDTPGAESAPLVLSSLKFCPTSATAPFTSTNCSLVPSQASPLVTADGKYWVDPATGEVTFDPDPDFSGTVTQSVQYVVADSLGQETTAKITLSVSNPTPPAATPETLSVLPGGTISYTTITGSSGLATGTGLVTSGAGATCLYTPNTTTCDADNVVTINGQGTYTLDPATGVVTYVADPGVTQGTKTSITYRVTDIVGQTATSTLTPVVPPPPVALNDTQAAGAYDTNQTIRPLTNDAAGAPSAPLVLSSLKFCPTSATAPFTSTNCSLVPSQANPLITADGKYWVDPATGEVTFDPDPDFSGTVTQSVQYVVADSLGQETTAKITLSVSNPTPPAATPETLSVLPGGTISYTTITGSSGLATGTGLVTSGVGATCLYTPNTTTCDADNVVTINGQGTYTLDPATGVVTYVADPAVTPGTKTSITYRVTDIVGQTATSTLTPFVPPPPVAVNDTNIDEYDTNQSITPMANDRAGDQSAPLVLSSLKFCPTSATAPFTSTNCSLVPSQANPLITADGKYWVDPATGVVTFDPDAGFVGVVTVPVRYVVADVFDRVVTATITPEVRPPLAPTANPTETFGVRSEVQNSDLLDNDFPGHSSIPLALSTLRLCDVGETAPGCSAFRVTVTEVGEYVLDPATGVVSFTPESDFIGTADSLPYMVADEMGRVVSSTYTPTVVDPPELSNDSGQSEQGIAQIISIFDNDTPANAGVPFDLATLRLCRPTDTPPACSQTSVTVAGEGIYSINSDGTVTFAPEPEFVGVATPIAYVVEDVLGQVVWATIHPTVTPRPEIITIAGQKLPMTGSDLLAFVGWAVLLFSAGFALEMLRRRRLN